MSLLGVLKTHEKISKMKQTFSPSLWQSWQARLLLNWDYRRCQFKILIVFKTVLKVNVNVTMSSGDEDDPKSEKHKFILVEDSKNTKKGLKVYRGNLKSEKDIEEWIESYKEETFTGWIVERVHKEENCKR